MSPRPRSSFEVDGVHYHFISRRQFDLMKAAGDLLESAEAHGNCYGTPREPVMIEKRLENARREIARWRQYDYVVVNDDLQQAYARVSAIIATERVRCPRVAEGVEAFVANLLGG
jgi:guanylate kinase